MPSQNTAIAARRARVQNAAAAIGLNIDPATLTPVPGAPAATPPAPAPRPVAPPVAAVPPAPVAPPAAAPPIAPPVPAPQAAAPAAAPAAPATPPPGALSPDELAHLRLQAQHAAQLQAQLANQTAEIEALRQQVLTAPAAPAPVAAPAPAPAAPDADLQRQLAEAQAQLAALQAPRLTAETWTSQNVDFQQAQELWHGFEPMIRQMVETRAAELARTQVTAAITPIQQQLTTDVNSVREQQIREARQRFEAAVETAQPLARSVIPSPAFQQFLTTEVPGVGVTYKDVFNRHIAGQNVSGIDYVIKQYLASAPGTTTPPAVDIPPASGANGGFTPPPEAPQVEDLQALKRLWINRQITHAEYSERLAKATTTLRGMTTVATNLRH